MGVAFHLMLHLEQIKLRYVIILHFPGSNTLSFYNTNLIYMEYKCVFILINLNMLSMFLQYPLYNMIMFDEWQNGIPIAFIVIGKTRECDLEHVLKALSQQMPNGWMPSVIIVDNEQVEINILRYDMSLLYLSAHGHWSTMYMDVYIPLHSFHYCLGHPSPKNY